MDPFPIIKYSSSPCFLDEIDVINKPAFVVPMSGLRTDSIESNLVVRKKINFTVLPYSFIDRSNWEDLNRGTAWADTEVAKGESLRLISYLLPPESRRLEIINLCKRFVDIPEVGVSDFHSLARAQTENFENQDGEEEIDLNNDGDAAAETYDMMEINLLNKFV